MDMYKSKCLVPKTPCTYPTPATNLFIFQYNQQLSFFKYGKSSKIDFSMNHVACTRNIIFSITDFWELPTSDR